MNERAQSPRTVGRGGARPGAGRKPLPVGARRGRKITIVYTDAQHDALEQAADEAGVTVAELVYQRSLMVTES